MTKLQITGIVIAIMLALDFLFFVVWAVSGQNPMDNFFFGTITYHTLQLIF